MSSYLFDGGLFKKIFFSSRYFFYTGLLLNEAKMVRFKCFHVNIKSRDEVLSLRPFRDPSSPPPHSCFQPSCVQFVPPSLCPACIVLCWIYTDANSPVDVQLWAPGPQRLPFFFFFATILPPSASHSSSPSLLPPPAALLPILGDLGAVLKVPHSPEAVSGPLPSHERNTQ